MPEKSILKYVNIPLNGKLVTSMDGSSLAEGDFQVLKNMRYGDITPKSITGMTKINTLVINADYLKPRAGFHFRKSQPAESHVLVQAFKADATSKVYENTTAIPSAGNFTATQIWSDTTGALTGEFSNAPDGCVAYANGKDTCVWGGSEYRCAGFILKSTSVAATGTLTSTGVAPTDTDTVTIGVKVYTFKTALTPVEGEVLIGGSAAVALDNLRSAINHTGTPDTDYKCAAVHPTVTATTNADTTQVVQAKTAGTSGNSIATTKVAVTLSWGAVTLTGGLDEGTTYLYDYTEQINNTINDSLNRATLSVSPAYVYIASTRPIKGAKFYVSQVNASAATVAVSYWANSVWTAVTTLVDGTVAVAGKTLSQTGSITFDTTVAVAKPRIINNVYAYWYLFVFTGIDAATSIYHVTLDAPFQQMVDLWDGNDRPCLSYMRYVTGYTDETYNVLAQDYVSGAVLTYSDVSSLATSGYLICGFAERMTGIGFNIVTGKANSNACIMTVSYWNGTAWTSVGTIDDGTRTVGTSFSKSGSVTWDAPIASSEFRSSISSGDLWHYYKISFNATLSANVYLDCVTGIPAQKVIAGYSWPVVWQNRVWLLDETSNKRNSAICSSQDTVVVFNGSDSTTLYFGNEEPLICGTTIFTRFGSNIYDNLIILKKDEAWLVDGTVPQDYKKYKIGDNTGCVAPKTLRSCDMGYEIAPGLTKHVLIWQAENAVVIFDGNVISPISGDIANYFDRTKSECIPDAMKGSSTAFYDESKYEYHWCFASGTGQTTLNKEFVYSLLKRKWFEIDRGTGKYLQIGFSVKDTNGNNLNYGGIDTGYIERLEYGTTFDGNSIVSQFKTLDIPFGGYNIETAIRHLRLIAVSKSTTTNTVSVSHFGDGINTSSSAAITLAVRNTTNRFVRSTQSVNWGNFLFHSFSFSLTTTNESVAMEPVGLGIMYEVVRESVL
jgi:hypothetical protein